MFTHRVDGALRINPHIHSIVLDGVYDTAEQPRFHELPLLTLHDLESILSRLVERFVAALRRLGRLGGADKGEESSDEQGLPDQALLQLAASQAAATSQASALGRGNEWIEELGRDEVSSCETDSSRHSVRLHGFSLYASPAIAGCAAASRERLARYIARPPIAESRLSVMDDGYILIHLKRRFRNGTHSVRLHPFAFLERLCTLLPRPRRHELTYHGVLAPACPRRPRVIPEPTSRRLTPTLPPRSKTRTSSAKTTAK